MEDESRALAKRTYEGLSSLGFGSKRTASSFEVYQVLPRVPDAEVSSISAGRPAQKLMG
jgi:hypothetical protein